MTNQNRPPLFELFTRLRNEGITLGIDEYKLLLTALEGGFGAPDLESLFNLCKTLWVRSDSDQRIFERVFQEVVFPEKKSSFPGDDPMASTWQQDIRSPAGPLPDQPSAQTESSLDSTQEAEQQVVQAILPMKSASQRFALSDEYFPITRRQMKQSWRKLRHPVRQGLPTEIDIEKTVEEIGRLGFLLEPIFLSHYVNRAEVLLLIDQGGSMVPFHPLSARLTETALYEGGLINISVYYFRNYPLNRLFRTPSHQDSIALNDILTPLSYDRSSVLIFSDAGAARGYFNQRRLKGTKVFLEQLAEHVRYQAWLNPMPLERWHDTTAQGIQHFIPMFDISRRGMEHAIDVLRGRSKVE